VLIENGADINSKNDDGETPLHRSVANGRDECVRLLLSHGADMDAKSNSDLTPEQLSALSNISPKNIRGSFFKSKMTTLFDEEKAKRDQMIALIRSKSNVDVSSNTLSSPSSSVDSLYRTLSYNDNDSSINSSISNNR